jgi:hypothetical protein
MKAHLRSFESYRKEPITFDSFDVHFYEDFVRYLTYHIVQLRRIEVIKGLKVNSVGKTIKHLKSFLKDRMRKKIIPYMDLGTYKVMEEEVDAVYLTWQELSLIYHLDLSTKRNLEKYRDLFVLGCLTGFRFSDYSDIKPEEVRNGMLHINQTKTLSTVVVPLRSDAKKILIDKYNMQMPQVSNPNFNYYIKEVVRLAGIDEMIKITHKRGNKGLEEKLSYTELDLEESIITHLQNFLLEMGRGFCFEARQKRITFDNTHYRIDLVFYHRILKCHVLLDLKIGEFDHSDAGQMNMYLNYYKDNESANGDHHPLGIILCSGKNEALVKYATMGLPQQVFVSKYLINLPSEKELKKIIEEEKEKIQ